VSHLSKKILRLEKINIVREFSALLNRIFPARRIGAITIMHHMTRHLHLKEEAVVNTILSAITRLRWLLSIAFMFACANVYTGSALAGPVHPRIEVGTRCQQDYQNNWQVDVGNSDVWRRCSNFNNQIKKTENLDFYYNLHGAQAVIEKTSDGCGWGCGSADSVDMFYMNTHAGANGTSAFWAMWDQNSNAQTSNMRLGDNSRELMVLATFACNTLQTSDGLAAVIARWLGTFAGGLVMTVGAHANLYAGNDQSATEFASRMQDGEPIGRAWLESAWYANNSNTPSAMNVGRDANDCWNRAGTTLINLFATPILRDSSIGYICWSSWN
jgi:Family of unknown function (DUF6345)